MCYYCFNVFFYAYIIYKHDTGGDKYSKWRRHAHMCVNAAAYICVKL